MVEDNTPLREMMQRGTLDLHASISPESGYRGPAFYGGYGRSANGSVDTARFVNDSGPYGQDVLGFTEGYIGLVDQIYGAVIFRSESFEGRFKNKPISLAKSEAMSIRTYTGYIPDQKGWVYFYVEVGDEAFVSPPFPYTEETKGDWGEKTITVDNPRELRWTHAVFRDDTAFLAEDRPEAKPNFDEVTAVGFVFHTTATEGTEKNVARFMTDFFMVSAD